MNLAAAPSQGLYIHVDCEITRESGLHVATCVSLGVTASGATAQEAVEGVLRSLDLYLEACIKKGLLRDVLLRLNSAGAGQAACPRDEENHAGKAPAISHLHIPLPALDLASLAAAR